MLDVIKVTGTLIIMDKGRCLRTFMAQQTIKYNPRVLVATSGASNAGIDLNDIYPIFCLDMPLTYVNIVQE